MLHPLQRLESTIKAHGFSLTKPRKAVFFALLDQEPMTMSDLIASLNSTVDRASIYRIISLYEKLHIVNKLQMGWKYKLELSDAFGAHHHHITCTSCGYMKPFEESATIAYELKQLASEYGFKEMGHQLEMRGVCTRCQKAHGTLEQ